MCNCRCQVQESFVARHDKAIGVAVTFVLMVAFGYGAVVAFEANWVRTSAISTVIALFLLTACCGIAAAEDEPARGW